MTLDRFGFAGMLTCAIITPDPDAVIVEGMDYNPDGWRRITGTLLLPAAGPTPIVIDENEFDGQWVNVGSRHNAFVNSGLQCVLNRWANIGGPPAAPTRIAVSSDNTAVTAATTTFGGTFRSNTMNATFPSTAAQTTSFQADFTKGSGSNQIDFSVRKMGLTNASTDAASAVQDIIGGAGTSPYAEALTIDLTATTSFTLRPQIDVTASAV